MMTTSRLKVLAAVLLALSLTLPAYTCAGYVAPDGEKVGSIPRGADSSAYQATKIPHWALESPNPRDTGFWLAVLAFTWPLPLLALRARRPQARLTRWLWWAEPALAVGSGYVVWAIGAIGDPAIGTYVALAANAALIALWVRELFASRAARAAPAAAPRTA